MAKRITKKQREKWLKRMQQVVDDSDRDPEKSHGDGDALLCEVLDELGYKDLTELFWKSSRWYA